MKQKIYKAVLLPISLFFAVLIGIVGVIMFLFLRRNVPLKPKIVWGSTPLINNSYWSKAMKASGYYSRTFTFDFFSIINRREDWDWILNEKYPLLPNMIKPFIGFLHSVFVFDVFVVSADGYFLGNTFLKHFEVFFLKLYNKKIVLIPYGSDSYVYRELRSTGLLHGLLMSYPNFAIQQGAIKKRRDQWIKYSDVVIPGFMGPDGFGRWDLLCVSPLVLDLNYWGKTLRRNASDGRSGTVLIAHAPNHRGFKGTEFVIDAIKKLQSEGLLVELLLLEKLQNSEVRDKFTFEIDILVEQLVFTGHGMNGIEGLASGIPTISNLENEDYILPLRRWSYFGECPLVSATPENLVDVLRKLVTRPELRHQLGDAGRAYVEKYHGLDAAQYLFTNVIEYVYGRKESLINLYHPLLGEYPNRSPKIQHPLNNNRIAD